MTHRQIEHFKFPQIHQDSGFFNPTVAKYDTKAFTKAEKENTTVTSGLQIYNTLISVNDAHMAHIPLTGP